MRTIDAAVTFDATATGRREGHVMEAERQKRTPGRSASAAAAVAGLGALCAVLLAARFAAWRGRLPDPMASHFALNGAADGYLAPGTWLAVALGLVAGTGVLFAVLLRVGGRQGQRRTGVAAGAGTLVLLTTIFVTGLHANLDLVEGSHATLPVGWIGVALVLGAGAATAAWRLAGPDAPPGPAVIAADRLELGEAEAASWSRAAGVAIWWFLPDTPEAAVSTAPSADGTVPPGHPGQPSRAIGRRACDAIKRTRRACNAHLAGEMRVPGLLAVQNAPRHLRSHQYSGCVAKVWFRKIGRLPRYWGART
jgi:hypothetical protein